MENLVQFIIKNDILLYILGLAFLIVFLKTDLKDKRIKNKYMLYGTVSAIILNLIMTFINAENDKFVTTFINLLKNIGFNFALFFILYYLCKVIFKVPAMGAGDIKIYMFICFLNNIVFTIEIFLMSIVITAIYGICIVTYKDYKEGFQGFKSLFLNFLNFLAIRRLSVINTDMSDKKTTKQIFTPNIIMTYIINIAIYLFISKEYIYRLLF